MELTQNQWIGVGVVVVLVVALVAYFVFSKDSLRVLRLPPQGSCQYQCMVKALKSGGSAQEEVNCIQACPQ